MERAIIIVTLAMSVAGLGYCNKTHAADNTIMVDQIGSNNTITVVQDGAGHTAAVKLGAISDVDYTTISITQQGAGKLAKVEIPSGVSNNASIQQDGTGNHIANIQNLNGSANNITIGQSGAGNHTFNVAADPGTTNSGNTINATQSGSGNKQFDLTLSGTSGASVTVQQTNPIQSNGGSMNIQCTPCGAYSYIRN
jgi:hypothetical protein